MALCAVYFHEYLISTLVHPLTWTDRSMSSWWLLMPWCQIGARSTATIMLTWQLLQFHQFHPLKRKGFRGDNPDFHWTHWRQQGWTLEIYFKYYYYSIYFIFQIRYIYLKPPPPPPSPSLYNIVIKNHRWNNFRGERARCAPSKSALGQPSMSPLTPVNIKAVTLSTFPFLSMNYTTHYTYCIIAIKQAIFRKGRRSATFWFFFVIVRFVFSEG